VGGIVLPMNAFRRSILQCPFQGSMFFAIETILARRNRKVQRRRMGRQKGCSWGGSDSPRYETGALSSVCALKGEDRQVCFCLVSRLLLRSWSCREMRD
jgi:hypothetical protein